MVATPLGRFLRSARAGAVLAACLLGAAAAQADLQLRPGMTGVADLGAISCATFNDMYPNGPTGLRQAALYYAEGYIFAQSGKSIDELLATRTDEWDFDRITDAIVDYCAAEPEARVSDSVTMLWQSLKQE